jgi:hypothetical protein
MCRAVLRRRLQADRQLMVFGIGLIGLRDRAGTGAADLCDQLRAVPLRLAFDAGRFVLDLLAIQRERVVRPFPSVTMTMASVVVMVSRSAPDMIARIASARRAMSSPRPPSRSPLLPAPEPPRYPPPP